MKTDIILLPKPKTFILHEGFSQKSPDEAVFIPDPQLPNEAYCIIVEAERINISASGEAGAFYAGQTLRQLQMQGEKLPCCEIRDEPGLEIRGFMLDISRGKVPKLETLYYLADIMALLKMNHLQLYVEGFSFQYPSFSQHWDADSALSPGEISALGAYCRERFIDLVPCMNCLGHMGAWLAKPEFNPLAEAPEGISIMDFTLPPTTLDVNDPGSLRLALTMMEELCACHESGLINMCMDEPFELGRGKNIAALESEGVEGLYGGYLDKIHSAVSEKGLRMMMWGDILAAHPALYERMPKDILIMEWGYEAEHPFEKRTQVIAKNGLDFCVCPGTSAWGGFAPMTDNAFENISRAAGAAYKYGGRGLILCDWGDGGHLQCLSSVLPELALASSLAWSGNAPKTGELTEFVNRFIFSCDGDGAGGLLRLGQFSQFERMRLPCRTLSLLALSGGKPSKESLTQTLDFLRMVAGFLVLPEVAEHYADSIEGIPEPDFKGFDLFLDELEEEHKKIQPADESAELICAELKNTLSIIRLGRLALEFALGEDSLSPEEKSLLSGSIRSLAAASAAAHEKLWLARNKRSGLEQTLGILKKLSKLD